MASFTIPFPPSVNDMFLNNRGKGRGRIKSHEYRVWIGLAGWELKRQKATLHPGRNRIEIKLDDKRQGDCDNRIKPVLDLLVASGTIEGDQKKFVKGVCAEWADIDECQVTIIPVK